MLEDHYSSSSLKSMQDINIKLYRSSLALYVVGTLLYCIDYGVINPFTSILFLSCVMALAVVCAPVSRMQTAFYVFLLVFPLTLAAFSIAGGLAGGRSDVNPDPLTDISTGVSFVFFSFVAFCHYQTVRSSPTRALRWFCCFVGLMLVSNATPDLLEPTLRVRGIPLAILGLSFLLYSLFPVRISFNVLAVTTLAWISKRGYVAWMHIGVTQFELTGLTDTSKVTFAGLVCYIVAVVVELWRFRLLTIIR